MMYKVLWLDDDFGTPKMDSTFESFRNNQKKGTFAEFEVTTCRNYDEFNKYFEADMYQAVILDVIGNKDEKDDNKTDYPFHTALRYLEDKDVIVKVYSGDPDERVTTQGSALRVMEDKGWKKDKDYFFKSNDYFSLFKVLSEELKQKMYLYKNRDYLIKMFSPERQYLDNVDQAKIKTILEAEIIEGNNYRVYRDVLENILLNLVYRSEDSREEYQFIPSEQINFEDKHSLFGRLCKWFWVNEKNPRKNNKAPGRIVYECFYKDKVTDGDCLQMDLIIDAIRSAYNFCNKIGGHGSSYIKCRDFNLADYVKAASSSMLVILSWYYNHREKFREKVDE